jgi:hypothetical protein
LKGSISRWRDARGSTTTTTTQDQIRETIAITMIMGILVIIGMETMDTISAMVMDISTVEEMATTIMATRDTITTLEEEMVITMEVIMAITIAMTRTGCRRTSAKCYATSATTRGIMPMIALRRKQRRDSSRTHFRRDMSTMSMLRKFRRNPML